MRRPVAPARRSACLVRSPGARCLASARDTRPGPAATENAGRAGGDSGRGGRGGRRERHRRRGAALARGASVAARVAHRDHRGARGRRARRARGRAPADSARSVRALRRPRARRRRRAPRPRAVGAGVHATRRHPRDAVRARRDRGRGHACARCGAGRGHTAAPPARDAGVCRRRDPARRRRALAGARARKPRPAESDRGRRRVIKEAAATRVRLPGRALDPERDEVAAALRAAKELRDTELAGCRTGAGQNRRPI